MTSMSDAATEGGWRHRRSCAGASWSPIEILAMVLGFIVFWPIGLAILGWKVWQRRSAPAGQTEDLFASLRDKVAAFQARGFGPGRGEWRGFGGTGNSAFDDWRRAEVERLEEERRKLERAQQDFADFVAEARKARDREEFERFMANWKRD